MTFSNCYIILLLLAVGLLGCKSPKQATANPEPQADSNVMEESWPSAEIPRHDCKAAIDYMEEMVVALDSDFYGLQIIPADRSENTISIKELKDMKCWRAGCIEKYLTPSCFVGKESDAVFELFCTKESIDDYKKLDQLFVENEKKWMIHFLVKHTDVGLSFVLKKGVVQNFSFGQSIEVSH